MPASAAGAYFDNNATTPPLPAVVEAMRPCLEANFGNASSIHRQGQQARAMIEAARAAAAELIGAEPNEIVFTSGGTEADNLALFGMIPEPRGAHLIVSAIEHHAVLHTARELAERGAAVSWLPATRDGRVRPADVEQALRPETRLISVMLANNETGVIQPIEAIGRIARQARVPLHVDAVQAAGKIPVSVEELGCSLLSFSAHKFHGPQGVGALYVRRGTRLRPLFYGGRHERERRAGTENLAGIAGMGAAARLALRDLEAEARRQSRMRDALEAAVKQSIPEAEALGAEAPRVPNTSCLHIPGIAGEALVIALDLRGYCISTGAACSSGAVEPSHVLTAMGLEDAEARACVRISLGKLNREAEAEAFCRILPAEIARLLDLSPARHAKIKSGAISVA